MLFKTCIFFLVAAVSLVCAARGGEDRVGDRRGNRVRLVFDSEEILVAMLDTPAAWDFVALLPLTLTIRDYNATEQVADLPRRLTIDGAPVGFDPSVGDLAYYAPWGNLAIFYQDFGYSPGLVHLGVIESGVEKLARAGGDFAMTIERVD